MSLPGADDLFRRTSADPAGPPSSDGAESAGRPADAPSVGTEPGGGARHPSGRVRHDEKMTVYVTADELLDLEHARLTLRRHHGVAVDRGRLVRAAVAIALADLDSRGEDSSIVQRLQKP